MTTDLVYLSVGFLLGGIATTPRIKDLKRELEFWRNQAKQYEERDRVVAQEIRELLAPKHTKGN